MHLGLKSSALGTAQIFDTPLVRVHIRTTPLIRRQARSRAGPLAGDYARDLLAGGPCERLAEGFEGEQVLRKVIGVTESKHVSGCLERLQRSQRIR